MRSEKSHLVNYIGGLLTGSDYIYFVSYQGLQVKQFSQLRNQLAGLGAECHVLKNTLIRKAAELSSLEALAKSELTDSTAVICGKGDPSAVAKAVIEFGKTNEALAAKGGYFEGALLSVADFDAIASLPPKEVLQAQLLGVLQAPSRNLVSLLNAKAASILNVLNAYKEKLDN
ncbi:50S ribosomal protein L10 [Victivallis sp. Marseille-Q1083]|uniref:50S ribosomal protein L10 n=1 Tax=Victivallis sp. Marseille-Q1083 TaxID=2717288 RepID=UPI00158B7E2D|nr:50S ribosomal protein L10 [Victivallis sp. Marseille-Q1083]